MNLNNPKDMWDKLRNVYTKVGQRVVYLIFQELFNYPKVNKAKRYNKSVIQIFAEVQYPYKRLRIAITSGHDLYNTFAIVISLDTLDDNFDITTTSLLEIGNMIIDQIQSILQSKEAKNLSKQSIRAVRDIAMTFRDNYSRKKKGITKVITNNNECFNYH